MESGKTVKLAQMFDAHHEQNTGTECKSAGGGGWWDIFER